jgi:HlyD family secretion protein
VRILILSSSYQDLVKEGNKFPFRPGMTANVDIITTRKNDALSVPLASVTTRKPKEAGEEKDGEEKRPEEKKPTGKKEEDKIVVFVNNNGVAKMVEVKTGISDYDNIEILSGITDSTEVVTGPFLAVSKQLKDGEKIRPQEKKNEKKKEDETK